MKLDIFNGGVTEGTAAWRDTGKIFSSSSANINIRQETDAYKVAGMIIGVTMAEYGNEF